MSRSNLPQWAVFSVEQIVAVVKQAELGVPAAELIRQVGITEQTLVCAKEIATEFDLWLQVPECNMTRPSGEICSIATGAGEFHDHERHLFFTQSVIDEFLKRHHLAMLWLVRGERQHFSNRHHEPVSRGYKQFHHVYRYRSGRPRRVI